MTELFFRLHRLHSILYENGFGDINIDNLGEAIYASLSTNVAIISSDCQLKYISVNNLGTNSYIQGRLTQFGIGISSFVNNLVKFETNVDIHAPFCLLRQDQRFAYFSFFPIIVEGKYLSALVVWTEGERMLTEDELVICEAATAMLSMVISRNKNKEQDKNQILSSAARLAVNVLSFSEQTAIKEILKRLKNGEGNIVISQLAEEIFITRPVISSALKKLESSEMIVVRSMGTKGSYIKVLNMYIYEAMEGINTFSHDIRKISTIV